MIPGLGRSLGEGNGDPLQYSCLGNPMDRGSWQATVHGVTKESDKIYLLKQQNIINTEQYKKECVLMQQNDF